MAKGLDLYERYNKVTDWKKVKESGVEFIWFKATDGAGKATVPADNYVREARRAGIPFGGYHFAQKRMPINQATVFINELWRLNALDIIPALDIENNTGITWTGAEAHDFVMEFSGQLLAEFPRVALYANTSELRAMRAFDICQHFKGRVVVWEANYSSNNGQRHALTANAWAPYRAAHQYTSRGTVAGASGFIDINESFMDLSLGGGTMASLDTEDLRRVTEDTRVQVMNPDGSPIPGYKVSLGEMLGHINRYSYVAQDNSAIIITLLKAMETGLDEDQAELLAAYSAHPTQINMSQENVQQLLAGMSAASVKAFRDVATAILTGTTEGAASEDETN